MWLPDNPLGQRAGVGDSREEALTYMEATIGDDYRATSRERKEAFVDGVADFVTTAEKYGMRFARAADYPDYYPELPGGKIGRALEVEPFDSKKIGAWWKTSRALMPLPLKTDDVWLLSRAWSTPAGFVRGAGFVFRTLGGAVRGKRLVGTGAGLACSFLDVVVNKQRTPLWLNAPVEGLVTVDGRVVGVQTVRDGRAGDRDRDPRRRARRRRLRPQHRSCGRSTRASTATRRGTRATSAAPSRWCRTSARRSS